jgi:hypothetical protein
VCHDGGRADSRCAVCAWLCGAGARSIRGRGREGSGTEGGWEPRVFFLGRPWWASSMFAEVLIAGRLLVRFPSVPSINRGNLPNVLGKFGSQEPRTEQEPKYSVSVLFGSVLGFLRFSFGFRYFAPRLRLH